MTESCSTPTGCLALADGTVLHGMGFGAEGTAVGELCFNTAMTGYQEILTDPSYAGQVVLFTFPHIGNVGVNPEDEEAPELAATGLVVREMPTAPSNWRSVEPLTEWLMCRGCVGLAGIDTRQLTRRIRNSGMPHVALCHDRNGGIDADALVEAARGFAGLEGVDMAAEVTCKKPASWEDRGHWAWPGGFASPEVQRFRSPSDDDTSTLSAGGFVSSEAQRCRVAVLDYGAKRNILRCLTVADCDSVLLPATSTGAEILATQPDGVLLSNGPGDPAGIVTYAALAVQEVLEADVPVFGICLGHQLLASALGANTVKMHHGHHGANHPVRDLATGRISVVSMNHGFAVDRETLPDDVTETHVSLFDGSNCGIQSERYGAFSVQFHPEASPGPQDSFSLFDRFSTEIKLRHIGMEHVLAAMREFNSKGLTDMITEHGGGGSVKWYIRFQDRRYDQKLILQAAHAHAGGTSTLVFKAGESRRYLERLGFTVEKD